MLSKSDKPSIPSIIINNNLFINYQGYLEASQASDENGIRILLATLISFPGGNKINKSPQKTDSIRILLVRTEISSK